MAKEQSIHDFIETHGITREVGAVVLMTDLRDEIRRWVFDGGGNPPTGRFVTRVLKEHYSVEPIRVAKGVWGYAGLRWPGHCDDTRVSDLI